MKAIDLYNKMDSDFKVDSIGAEDWGDLSDVEDSLSNLFKKRNEGIMYDNTNEIQKVYSITFPEPGIIQSIIDSGEENVLIFSHHAQSWRSEKKDNDYIIEMNNLPKEILQKMKNQKISLYSLHIPLDNLSEYSTGNNFAKAIDVEVEKGCCLYLEALTGLIGKAPENLISKFSPIIERSVGHEVKVYSYGSDEIKDSRIGMVTGWGTDLEVLEEMHSEGINTFITGFTNKLPKSKGLIAAHEYAEKNCINLIGTTHYSSEKFACKAMVEYFEKLGLPTTFIEGKYHLNDL